MKFPGYYTKKELEQRDWTIKMFKDYLPRPHKKVANPYNQAWTDIGLYEKDIVEEIESRPNVQSYMTWANGKFRPRMRKLAAARTVQRKIEAGEITWADVGEDEGFYTPSELKSRHWNSKMIDDFRLKASHYNYAETGGKTLYLKCEVHEIENSTKFKERMDLESH